jgi:conjugative relaxase-like TrwC/TraI family protein
VEIGSTLGRVMTISRLSAGNGYAYYTSVTASADQRRGKGELGDYYLDTGTPPGHWMGRGADVLGVNGQVTEEQMRALFGDGLHPNADQQIASLIQHGMSAKQALAAVRLGREFARYNNPETNELAAAIATETTRQETALGRNLTSDEAQAVRMKQAGILFNERHGRAGARHEVARFMSQELTKRQQPVAGFDLTFSAPKSVSVAWAVADPAGAAAIEQAHQRAIEITLAWLEDEVIHTRTGAGGIALHKTTGLIATRFRHWESREGDPQLHDHVVISNRVQAIGQDKWRTIDSKSLYRATVNASTVYDKALADELKSLGLQLRERVTPSGKFHAMELAIVTDRQLERFSSRTIAIESRTRELVTDYVEQHGRQPGTKELLALRQQATLETRTPKSQAVTRDDLRTQWRAQMGDAADTVRRGIEAAATGPRHVLERPVVDIDDVARQIIDEVSARRSTWTRNHVETRINIWAATQHGIVDPVLMEQITNAALERVSFPVTPVVVLPDHEETVNPDGTSVYLAPWRDQYTSLAVLDAEDALLRAAHEVALPAVSEAQFEAAVLTHAGPVLNAGQLDLAHQVACSEHVVTVGIGPAGTGKTTAMQLAITAVRSAGLEVHGVTVSAAAADQLQQATGMESTTIAKWLRDVETGARGVAAGDVIVVDEAGMASARDLAQITAIANQRGAFVRLVGDDRQLQAIGAGGSVRMLAAEVGAVRLDQVHRFHNADEAAASLVLREHGDVDWYITNRRVHGGSAARIMADVVDGWAADEAAGRSSLMMAGTNNEVATLNTMAQERRVADGAVDLTDGGTVELADGCVAGVGDRIVTRRNDRRMTLSKGQGFVKNGDLWTITEIGDNGSVNVVDPLGRTVILPAEYVAASTGLGYASTVHRAQGQTVDNARLLITPTTTREALYVGLSRGRTTNDVYAITDGTSAVEQVRQAASNVSQAVSARELIAEAQREAGHPAHLVRILRDMQQRADQHRYTAIIRRELPHIAGLLIESDKRDRLYTAIARAEDAGFTAQRILAIASAELPSGQDPTGLLAWRIGQHLKRAEDHRHTRAERPLADVPQARLDELLQRATTGRQEALQALRTAGFYDTAPAVLKDGSDVPSWTDRTYGHLDDDTLRTRLADTRATIRTIDGAIQESLKARAALRAEGRGLTHDQVLAQAGAVDRRLERISTHIARLRTDRNQKLRDVVELHDETSIRRQLDGRSWHLETVQRDAAHQLDANAPLEVSSALGVDDARQRWTAASDLQRGIWIETRLRTLDADRSINQRPEHAPAWAVPGRGATDPSTPGSWRPVLDEMADTVAAAIADRGAAIALQEQPPAWATRYLGDVPDADTALRERWEALAGQIETWRGLTDHTDPTKALPAPSRSHDASQYAERDLHVLHAAAADLRRDILNNRLDELRGRIPEPPSPAPMPTVDLPRATPALGVPDVVDELHQAALRAQAAEQAQAAAAPTALLERPPTLTEHEQSAAALSVARAAVEAIPDSHPALQPFPDWAAQRQVLENARHQLHQRAEQRADQRIDAALEGLAELRVKAVNQEIGGIDYNNHKLEVEALVATRHPDKDARLYVNDRLGPTPKPTPAPVVDEPPSPAPAQDEALIVGINQRVAQRMAEMAQPGWRPTPPPARISPARQPTGARIDDIERRAAARMEAMRREQGQQRPVRAREREDDGPEL